MVLPLLPPLRQSVHTTVMYIMYLFQVLQEDLCSFVLNQKRKAEFVCGHMCPPPSLLFFVFFLLLLY